MIGEKTTHHIQVTLKSPKGDGCENFNADTSFKHGMAGQMHNISEDNMEVSSESSDPLGGSSSDLDEHDDDSDDNFAPGKSPRKLTRKQKQAKRVHRDRQWDEDSLRKLAYGYIERKTYKQIIADVLPGRTVQSLRSKIFDLKTQKRLTKASNEQWVYWDTK